MFEFTSSLFFWTLINFLVLLVLIHKVALPSLYKMVDEHHAKKNQALTDLERNQKESQELLSAYQAKMAQVEEEVRQMLQSAKAEREQLKKQELEKLIQEKHAILANIRNELQVERKRFVEDLKDQAADLIVLTSKKILNRSLNKDEHLALINDSISDFEKLVK